VTASARRARTAGETGALSAAISAVALSAAMTMTRSGGFAVSIAAVALALPVALVGALPMLAGLPALSRVLVAATLAATTAAPAMLVTLPFATRRALGARGISRRTLRRIGRDTRRRVTASELGIRIMAGASRATTATAVLTTALTATRTAMLRPAAGILMRRILAGFAALPARRVRAFLDFELRRLDEFDLLLE